LRSQKRLILGVTWGTHDSAAVLFAGGRLVGFVEEERLSGVKHTGAFPKRSIAWLLAEAGAEAVDVDVVTSGFRSRGYAIGAARAAGQAMLARGQRRSWARARSYMTVAARCRARTHALERSFPSASVVELSHHLCHSAYAHAAAGGGDAVVLSVDSIGEWYSTALVRFDGSGLRLLRRVPDPHSLGYLYGAITEHLGYRRGDEEGTVMALAALGDPERYRPLLERAVLLTAEGFRLDPDLIAPRVFSAAWPRLSQRFIEATFPGRPEDQPLAADHADLAAALQARTEQSLAHLAQLARAETDAATLCLTGGVAMNCLAAARASSTGLFGRVFVPPAPGDAGTCIGAALLAAGYPRAEGFEDLQELARWDLGPAFSGQEIDDALREADACAERLPDPAGTVASDLLAGKIVGVFRGRAEAGPRALGNRSILASPLVDGITARLSTRVKLRETFRPFAPVLAESDARELFEIRDPSPYMSFAIAARARAHAAIPAVVHRNGTARLQTLADSDTSFLGEVLARVRGRSGPPALINTSLNVKGTPLAATPEQAIACFRSCELDALLLEDRYLRR
jgi:carbamoyltransferase